MQHMEYEFILSLVTKQRFDYIIQNYKINATKILNNGMKFCTMDIMHQYMDETGNTIEEFIAEYFPSIMEYGNMELFNACLPHVNKTDLSDVMVDFKIIHEPILRYVVENDMLNISGIFKIFNVTNDLNIHHLIASYAGRRWGFVPLIYIFMRTGNQSIFESIMTCKLEMPTNWMEQFLNTKFNLGRHRYHIRDIFIITSTFHAEDVTVFRVGDHFKFRLSWLLTQNIHSDLRFAHVWKYIHHIYGEVIFAKSLKKQLPAITTAMIP